ncbi:LCM-domain-containing protein [Zopfia rhizophila CBS 207.26]|uniref:tRNA wybutosine-synthesizing protein 4 n=1 Tax=Zopfia rhizophila CBS 207.26 TaxID=1314779 RepID=A0A6A6EED7_9PEZI|nr:LCM-domain-containing protein [Zopfia rhizophila CBS 207.26]
MSTASNMRSPKGVPKRKINVRSALERKDDFIMNTNDSSIVSKRSASKLYYPDEPDFYQPFVQKFVRRNPLINRGYWLRTHAIEQVVRRFLEDNSTKPKVIVNLGCGYDPLPFQCWHRYASFCENATFVDVDYPQLMERKIVRILTSTLLRDALLRANLRSSELPICLRTDKYMALGCDLRDLTTLERILKQELGRKSHSILFVAEVSLTYMNVSDSDSLIRWASTFSDARFCLLEQYLPQGPNHPFAKTMLNHFNKLQTPIHAVKEYPTLLQQISRFTAAGWTSIDVSHNLWELWSDTEFTGPEKRRALDLVEPFDEWEEFALFAGHYFLLVASNAKPKIPEVNDTDESSSSDFAAINDTNIQSTSFTFHVPSGNTTITPRRFGAAYILSHDTIAFHGGQGSQNRLTSIDVLTRNESTGSAIPYCAAQARVCHTITNINGCDALIVGGRKSPNQALSDCWYLNNGQWQRAHDLEPARFRHSAVNVLIPLPDSNIEAVLVFGGKTSAGTALDEWCLWIPGLGWQTVTIIGARPSARFGAAMSTMGRSDSSGLLVGGIDCDGTINEEIWEWEISVAPEIQLRLVHRTQDLHPKSINAVYARVGASLIPFGNSILLIGGVAKGQILSFSDDFVFISSGTNIQVENSKVTISGDSWPLLVGFDAAAVSSDEIIIAGGGAVCFSMGSFWNEEYISITKHRPQDSPPWTVSRCLNDVSVPQREKNQPSKSAGKKPKGKKKKDMKKSANPKMTTVPRITIQSSEEFSKLVSKSQPAIIEGLDFGPCTDLWTIEYLKEKIGTDRKLVVHVCESDRMTFKDKNFQYVRKAAGDFLDGISKGEKTYLRAVSASQPNKLPTKLVDDFPSIASDFRLPAVLSPIRETLHSSPLRISGPVSLWLHYDVLANVLCQIRGTKTLRLYPPSDAKYLDFPPGGSSSNVNVLTSKDPGLRHTHPYIAAPKPGDVLFIPPMWSHTATPEEGISIAVNVFFRNLDKGYAAGKDVYGNRDLQAYENGRKDVERIAKAFKDIPADISRFYLERLAMELQAKADKLQS